MQIDDLCGVCAAPVRNSTTTATTTTSSLSTSTTTTTSTSTHAAIVVCQLCHAPQHWHCTTTTNAAVADGLHLHPDAACACVRVLRLSDHVATQLSTVSPTPTAAVTTTIDSTLVSNSSSSSSSSSTSTTTTTSTMSSSSFSFQLLSRDVRAELRRRNLENAAVGASANVHSNVNAIDAAIHSQSQSSQLDCSESSSLDENSTLLAAGSSRQSRRLVKRRRIADERFHASSLRSSHWNLSFAFDSVASPVHANQDALFVPANALAAASVDRVVPIDAPVVAFAVFDGHGNGGEASSLVAAQVLAHELATLWSVINPADSVSLAHLIATEAIASTNAALLADASRSECGSTLCVALVVGKRLLHAHCGDSRIVLLRNQRLQSLTADHSGLRADERARVRAEGGVFVLDGSERRLSQRIDNNGTTMAVSLGMTRGLGHVQFARVGVTARPEFGALDLRPGDRVLLATDGVTDVISSDALRRALNNASSAADAVKALCDVTAHGRDDRSLIVVSVDDAVSVASTNSTN